MVREIGTALFAISGVVAALALVFYLCSNLRQKEKHGWLSHIFYSFLASILVGICWPGIIILLLLGVAPDRRE